MNNRNDNIIPSFSKINKIYQNKKNKALLAKDREKKIEKTQEEKRKTQENLKAKLKDRYRIKGVYFSNSQTEKKITHKKYKKEELLNNDEINFKLSMKDYEKLKHDIFLREKKQKQIELQEKARKRQIKHEINYTNLKENIYQFMRSKDKSNVYKVLKKNKMEVENANRNLSKNRKTCTLKKAVLHSKKVIGRIDNGSEVKEEFANEITLKNLLKRISKSREKFRNKKNIENENTPNNKKSKIRVSQTENNCDDLIFHRNRHKRYNTNKNFSLSNKTNIFLSNREEKNDLWAVNENKKNLKSNFKRNETDNNTTFNINNFNFSYNNNETVTTFYSHSNKNLNSNSNLLKSMSTNINILNSEKYKSQKNYYKLKTPNKLIKKTKKSQNYCKTQNNEKDILTLRRNFFEKFDNTQSNTCLLKRNSQYWNKNYGKRVQTAGFRKISNKVKHKPIYTVKITDLLNNFRRIKSASKRAKNNLRENHLATYKEIDEAVSVKEDMLMFLVKDKYFNNEIYTKKPKQKNNKKIFLTKFRNYIELVDNPYNYVLEDIENV